MSDIVIKAENLGKKYTIGHQATNGRYVALRDVLVQNVRSFWRATKDLMRGKPIVLGNELEEVWALKDVSFEVRRGEVVGIIGRNGAGKSTLLKVLSRITEPSAGRVTIKGRVASLLEVGTGFHPELTGRENIYLNGAILGMTRAEVKRKFDEIVAFAEIEKFLDTPVKRYSSGMYVRLAFAVAAHLEPEILLVDEVLAVGDAAFQKKCLGKMGDVASEGRTVLFVSHNMAAVSNLCGWTMLLDNGDLTLKGDSSFVIHDYLTTPTSVSESWNVNANKLKGKQVQIIAIDLLDLNGEPLQHLFIGGGLVVRIQYELEPDFEIPSASFVVRLKNRTGIEALRFSNTPISGFPIFNLRGSGQIDLVIPVMPFTESQYSLDVGLARQGGGFYIECLDVVSFSIHSCDVYNSGATLNFSRGINVVTHRWIHRPYDSHTVDSGWIGRQLLSPPECQYQ